MKAIVVLVLLVSIAGCAQQSISLNDTQKAYAVTVMQHPTIFWVPNMAAADAWARAESFISENSPTKLRQKTETLLQTNEVTSDSIYGYTIARTRVGDSTRFSVKCHYYLTHYNAHSPGITSMWMVHYADIASFNEHAAANYMTTGQVMKELLNTYYDGPMPP